MQSDQSIFSPCAALGVGGGSAADKRQRNEPYITLSGSCMPASSSARAQASDHCPAAPLPLLYLFRELSEFAGPDQHATLSGRASDGDWPPDPSWRLWLLDLDDSALDACERLGLHHVPAEALGSHGSRMPSTLRRLCDCVHTASVHLGRGEFQQDDACELPEGKRRRQQSSAKTAQARTHSSTCSRTHARTHPRTHPRTYPRTHPRTH